MTILKSAPHHSTQKFTFSKNTNSFIAEESDFGKEAYFGQIYSDSADEGFWLVSHKTGSEKPFALNQTFTLEGEVTHRQYCEINQKTGRPIAGGLSVTIFND